jgi:hypothetical protein
MKKSLIGILISLGLLSASVTASAEGLDTQKWDRYCKQNEENKERCERATQVCEQYEKADCDQIKVAFMERRPVEPLLPKD